jgi:hypothetical protein
MAGALLGWRPDEFWAATPAELAAVLTALAPGGRRSLAAALGAADAKALAEFRLAALWAGRVRTTIRAAWRAIPLRVGSRVALEGEAASWKVERWTLGPMMVTLEMVRISSAALPSLTASPGRAVFQPDLEHGPTIVRVLDLPLGEGQQTKPLLFVAAAGEAEGWRRAALSVSYDAGASWQGVGGTAAPAILGTALDALPPAGSALFDLDSTIEVELASDTMWLESRTDDALVDGANLAAIGDELIQFGDAAPLGDRRFQLSRLLRGRRGTEWAAGSHEDGEDFTLIDAASLVALDTPAGAIGGEVQIMASGVGDSSEAGASTGIEGAALQPPSPVHLTARETAGGDLAILWVRRSRQGWAWLSGSDAPLGEEAELYHLAIAGAGFERIADVAAPAYLYTAAERAADGSGPIQIKVTQAGTFATSRPIVLDLG